MAPTLFQSASILLSLISSLPLSDAHSHNHGKAHEHLHNLHKRDLVVPSSLPGTWTSSGCYTDNVGGVRTLQGAATADTTAMTDEACIAYCDGKGFNYAGTEYSQECYCGDTLSSGSGQAPAGDCNMACTGNASEACGGGSRLNLFWNHQAAPPPPVVNPGPNGWTSLGCYSEATNGRTLTNGEQTPGGGSAMTVALCTTACSNAGYTLAGVEYGGECYCGNTFVGGGAPATSGCSMTCNGNSSEYCGGPGHLNAYSFGPMTSSSTSGTSTTASSTSTSASTSATSTGSSGWSLVGCYTDQNPRTLLNFQQVTGGSAAMTIELCTAACKSGGYLLAGLEYSGECYCDNSYHNGGGPAPDGNALCNMPCNGNTAEICGGPNRLSVYSYAAPVVAPSWSFTGCYVDQAPRSLLNGGNVPGGGAAMTVELCQAACQSGGYTLAGVEYGGECYCDNSVHNGGGPAPDGNAGCNMPCNGNSSETCGGPNRLDLYTYGGGSGTPTSTSSSATSTATGPAIVKSIGQYNFLGCYTEATGARALQGATYDEPGMSLEICAAHCATFTYFGVEYGTECYCGNTLTAGSVLATTQADCSFICPGNQNEYCGAGNRLEMYQLNGNSTVSSSTTSSTSTSATPTGTGSASGLPAGWKYAGCYTEGVNGRAVAANTQPDNNALTIESCVNTCIGLGYTVAGTEFSSQCFCDNFVSNGGALTADTDCNMGCSGNATEKCGGPNRVSVYATGNLTVYGVPQTQTDNLPGSWQYQGCITDNINNRRSLDWQLILTDTNDATTCLSACSKFGYMAGGMEYGDECYCGDTSNLAIVGSTVRPDSECNDPCAGNRSTICGGGNRISYYTWTGTPLYNWAQPTGYGMGAYEFLIGGVCIPLMTSPAVNGKVTFVEKFGTGEPNSTGAYELDLSFVNDPTQAWRPMHVKTDVFCSAGVTLPDRAGRQINIGGWSGDSTFGVRLYWPDGSPGTPGVRDWQENVAELHLQTGRWYPSAMVMSNGSILVVGGEEGSNGAPVPSLELLPQVGPIMDLEFLRETDPFNLYPFLSVMPSGGILIIYYNQARILDPVTFATIKQLPNLPGAVNHPDGGRTYPLEGTAVLLPQHAPYSDPLTVLVCGGSTPGDSLAIDNCVSTQPDAANPQWVIERMPSQRVISCMTALPDGTYLILNGAHHGVAGFGLAQDPNLNAVLYDPSKEVNSRFSIMANTSVARLYHSEAVLLPDGRVLVSGSDPQDGTHPEEYRVEVFIPPYLLNGLPQPTFAIQNKDWTYGQTVTFTITSSQGNGIKVSLMGAETSTHGNSMGTRSIFPAVSCAGNTCTLTAPPDANTCPPGWFQMFVLDGPTPSHSTWVRIGGDPGQLGNWPPFSDFDTPGLGPV